MVYELFCNKVISEINNKIMSDTISMIHGDQQSKSRDSAVRGDRSLMHSVQVRDISMTKIPSSDRSEL